MIKKLVPSFFDKKKYVLHYKTLQIYLGLRLKTKKYIVYQNLIKLAKTHTSHLIYKKNRSRKNGDKDKKTLFKLMSNVVYGKTMKSLRNRVDARLVNNKKG